MKRRKGNILMRKFDLLNTQDYGDEISWSSSDNSDCENKLSNINLDLVSNSHRKKKRKKKDHRNLSSLNITIINSSDNKNHTNNDKSPILCTKYHRLASQSSILKPQLLTTHKDVDIPQSPILNNKMQMNKPNVKSPILIAKHQSTAVSPNVRKKLFHQIDTNARKIEDNLESSKRNLEDMKLNKENISKSDVISNRIVTSSESLLRTSGSSRNITKSDLMKRVQSFFDSNFSSESTSQHSISECETVTQENTPKSSEGYEISNSLSQNKYLQTPHEEDNTLINPEISLEKKKKIKYKKDGLAYRLNNLLKKQNCNISLWHHEKFLASNSNFIIPKSEYTAFRIKEVVFKYNCYLVESKDMKGGDYSLLINSCYVNSTCVIAPNYILKLYEPYKVMDLKDHHRLIVGVCKFECVPLKM